MTDLFESQLTEALHRRADERHSTAPSLAELHHRARTVPASSTAPAPGQGPRLLLAGVFAAVVALGAIGAWRILSADDTVVERIDSADDPESEPGPAPVDPDDPLTWPVDDGSPEQFRKGPNGEIATFDGEVINDEITVFLDGWFIARWNDSDQVWNRPPAEPGTAIEVPLTQAISGDLTTVVEGDVGVAAEACGIPGQETWALDGTSFEGLHVYADRPELGDLLPRPITDIGAQPEHAADIAAAQADVEAALVGTDLEPIVTRLIQVDVEGDGIDELLIEANTADIDGDLFNNSDQYSLLLLRRIGAGGDAETVTLHEAIGEDGQPYLLRATIAAVADVNGDGVFDLVTRDDYFEGFGGSIWSLDGDPAIQVQGGCGA
ncbi:MAG: hypothetical protein AAF467_23165 [Actinomycetota bacterium]